MGTSFKQGMSKIGKWIARTVDTLCDRPDHLQRLSIIGSGISIFPMIASMVALLVFFGLRTDVLAEMVVPILGYVTYGMLMLFALAQIALLGIIRGFRVNGPGGFGVEIETTSGDDDDAPTTTTKVTVPVAIPEPIPAPVTPRGRREAEAAEDATFDRTAEDRLPEIKP
ncbi:putative holin protein [Bajunvirus bajun]|uniref:Holin protein n=1 Tax=Brevundimonas phage vB_BgoS-Bajun TaxID=2948594 RepID=A0A9E7N7I3_9CAUD|nr:putative holin protein [Brevundimonas phage vB_BgoS-Bajun]